jgi:hypothetical protein
MVEAYEATVYYWYTTINTRRYNSPHQKNFFTQIMTTPSEPSHSHPPGPSRTSRKRQAPLDDNGDPVTIPASKKRKVVPPAGQTATSASKKTANLGPPNNTTKSKPDKKGKKRQSVEIEDVPDEDDRIPSNPPRNPESILELLSDDEDPSPSATSEGDPEVIEVLEEKEEDDEAELSEILLYTTNSYSPDSSTDVKEMDLARLCILQANSGD